MSTPVYIIAGSVAPGNRVKQFYSSTPDAARFLLRDAGQLRYAGFDLGIGDLAEAGPDGCWEAQQGDRKNLRLYHDGTLIFRAAADETFLGWGQDREPFLKHPRLNPVAVVEVHASFVAVYSQVLQRLKDQPTDVLFRLELRNVALESGERLFLTRVTKGEPRWQWVDSNWYRVEADPPRTDRVVPAPQVLQAPNAVAYQLVEAFYSLFDAPADLIPFVTEIEGTKQVDVDALRNA